METRMAVLAADYDERDVSAVHCLKGQVIEAKMETAKLSSKLEKQQETNEQSISARDERFDKWKLISGTLSSISRWGKISTKKRRLRSTKPPNLPSQLATRAFGDYKSFLLSEQQRKIERLEKIRKMCEGNLSELQSKQEVVQGDQIAADLDLESYSERLRVEATKYVRAKKSKGELEARFGG